MVPVLPPPLIGLYAIWARFPRAEKKQITMVIWAAILALTIAPIPLFFVDLRAYPEREKERIEAARAFNELQHQQRAASLARLTPDSSLRDCLNRDQHAAGIIATVQVCAATCYCKPVEWSELTVAHSN